MSSSIKNEPDTVAQAADKEIHDDQQAAVPPEHKEAPNVPAAQAPATKEVEVAAANGHSSLDGNPPDGAALSSHNKSPPDGAQQSGRSFPEILYDIVSDPDTDDICSWLPHGKGFMIHDKIRFGNEILPKYFDGSKYTSFTRRLKRWSFTRIARGNEIGAYYNENFIRDYPEKVINMKYRVVHGDVIGAAAAAMASGGTSHAAAEAALAAAMMVADKKRGEKEKRGGKRKMNDMDGMFPPQGMMGEGFPMQQWNNPYVNMQPMNMMQQQYFHMMMAQQFAAQQGGFNMNGQGSQDRDKNGDNQESNDNITPQKQFQGMPFFPPFPMMGMMPNMMQNMPPNMMSPNTQNMPNMMSQMIPNQMQPLPAQVNRDGNLDGSVPDEPAPST